MHVVPLWLLLLVIGSSAVLGGLLIRRHQRLPGPACGRCGYLVKGLPGWLCPECGSDLREVGIRVPGMYGPVPVAWKLVVWTLVILLLSVSSVTVVPQHILFVFTENRYGELPELPSHTYKCIDVETIGYGYRQPTRPQKLSFRLKPRSAASQPANTITMHIGLPDFTCRYNGHNDVASSELTRQRILEWMTDSGIDTQDPKVLNQADDLFRLAGQLRQGSNLGATGLLSANAMSAGARPPVWAVPMLVAVWLIIWVTGLWYIRRTRRPDIPHAPSPS